MQVRHFTSLLIKSKITSKQSYVQYSSYSRLAYAIFTLSMYCRYEYNAGTMSIPCDLPASGEGLPESIKVMATRLSPFAIDWHRATSLRSFYLKPAVNLFPS